MTPDSLHLDNPGRGVTTPVRPTPTGGPEPLGVPAGLVEPVDPRRGVTLDFYRRAIPAGDAPQDATNGGISGRCHQAVLVAVLDGGIDDPELRPLPDHSATGTRVAPGPHTPAVWLHRRIIGWPVWSLIPAMPDEAELRLPAASADAARVALRYWASRWAAGGNYASLVGTGLTDLVGFYGAVAVHDRAEW
jgi:hypothetical protein